MILGLQIMTTLALSGIGIMRRIALSSEATGAKLLLLLKPGCTFPDKPRKLMHQYLLRYNQKKLIVVANFKLVLEGNP